MDDGNSSTRARRAIPLIAVALTVIVVASLLYLHPRLGAASAPTAVKPGPSPPLLGADYSPLYTFVTPSEGWALVTRSSAEMSDYWVFHTGDGARHWTKQLSGFGGVIGYERLQFFDRAHGFFSFGPDSVATTTDGGRHWQKITLPPYSYSDATFCDPLHGWYLGFAPPASLAERVQYRFESTSDGGMTWTAGRLPAAGAVVVCRSASEGWASGTQTDNPSVYSTEDGGTTWQAHPLPATPGTLQGKPYAAVATIRLLPRNGVMAITVDGAFASFDSGTTWRPVALPPSGNYFEDIAFQDDMHWWAMRNGDLFKSSDAGISWVHVHLQLDAWDYVVGVIDARHAWARLDQAFPRIAPLVGTGLALTSDGGVHWTYANVPTPD